MNLRYGKRMVSSATVPGILRLHRKFLFVNCLQNPLWFVGIYKVLPCYFTYWTHTTAPSALDAFALACITVSLHMCVHGDRIAWYLLWGAKSKRTFKFPHFPSYAPPHLLLVRHANRPELVQHVACIRADDLSFSSFSSRLRGWRGGLE